MLRRAAVALLILLVLAGPAAAAAPQVAVGRGGAVAAAEENAAKVGIDILRRGGNAADAAVAVAFALAVTWPEAGNIGGGGFWISRNAAGRTLAVDFRETAPRTARRDLFVKPGPGGGKPRPRQKARSHRVCPVPWTASGARTGPRGACGGKRWLIRPCDSPATASS